MQRQITKGVPKDSDPRLSRLLKTIGENYQYTADLLVDLSLFFEQYDVFLASKLISAAKSIRPNGKRILQLDKRIQTKVASKLKGLAEDEESVRALMQTRDVIRRMVNSGLRLSEIYSALGLEETQNEFRYAKGDTMSNFESSSLNAFLKPYLKAECEFFTHQPNETSFPINNDKIGTVILKSVLEKIPFSLVRIGDGESTFLTPGNNRAEENDQNAMYQSWYGHVDFSSDDRKKFYKLLVSAIEDADIVGIPDLSHQLSDFSIKEDRYVRAYNRANRFVFDNPSKKYCSAYINQQYLQSGFFEEILSTPDLKLSIISGHDEVKVREVFEEKFGVFIEYFHRVPTQHKFAEKFNYEIDKDHYPTAFNEICESLSKRDLTGCVYFVGAGFLGKHYCSVIKRNGGVALDVGSVIDYLLGFKTRKYM